MTNKEQKTILTVEKLSLGFKKDKRINPVLTDISFELKANEILGIVGESGSGKSVTNLAILGLLPHKITQISSGSILFKGDELLGKNEKEFRKLRGNAISMIFQEPMSSLNPSMRCGDQVLEVLNQHIQLDKNEAEERVLQLFEQVKLPRPAAVFKAYPHEISGGQKQRVMIAMAIACEPEILIADEPTTALDVTVQKDIIFLLKELQAKNNMSIIFISHDLALISEIADRVVVMYKGKIVEEGTAEAVFKNPQKEYTKALIHAKPEMEERLRKLPTVADFMKGTIPTAVVTAAEREKDHKRIYAKKPLIEVKNVEKTFYSNAGFFKKTEAVHAVNDVSFKIYEGETLGLVGESGCGKSTLGNVILQLDQATQGQIFYNGKDIAKFNKKELRALRKDIQIIFQDPYSSLNPRLTVGKAITEAMQVHGLYSSGKERRNEAIKLLEEVGLLPEHYYRYPHEFSGGQRQRIGIARTIALKPKFIVCDESVSALDISVQAQVLNLLNDLKEKFGFTYLFISHDLAVVKFMADQLLVMQNGKIVESGEADTVYSNPRSDYTKVLIASIPKGI
ncbi:ABC transporter ATP-binding protein [Flavimarina sp. Hel_I_48]|uniref:ABC transporter ATP-binding protein n=1 Tax=Flavimarina sp. Hel_I_48 TaxID=1392488 RepID=UPI0004DFC802|nr:ABC transporter ATP-binding protein [Flavimarina sp. Hel_I_48]